jgi:hypothetical protein
MHKTKWSVKKKKLTLRHPGINKGRKIEFRRSVKCQLSMNELVDRFSIYPLKVRLRNKRIMG